MLLLLINHDQDHLNHHDQLHHPNPGDWLWSGRHGRYGICGRNGRYSTYCGYSRYAQVFLLSEKAGEGGVQEEVGLLQVNSSSVNNSKQVNASIYTCTHVLRRPCFSRREWEEGYAQEGCESRYTCCQVKISSDFQFFFSQCLLFLSTSHCIDRHPFLTVALVAPHVTPAVVLLSLALAAGCRTSS